MKFLRIVLSTACFLGFGAVILATGTFPSQPHAGIIPTEIPSHSSNPAWFPVERETTVPYSNHL